MIPIDVDTFSTDELWTVYEEIRAILRSRLEVQRRQLVQQLNTLRGRPTSSPDEPSNPKRRRTKSAPLFRNPHNAAQTWTGRGKQPRWVTEILQSGIELHELRISQGEGSEAGERSESAST